MLHNINHVKALIRGKYCLINLQIVKRLKKLNYNVEILFKTS